MKTFKKIRHLLGILLVMALMAGITPTSVKAEETLYYRKQVPMIVCPGNSAAVKSANSMMIASSSDPKLKITKYKSSNSSIAIPYMEKKIKIAFLYVSKNLVKQLFRFSTIKKLIKLR